MNFKMFVNFDVRTKAWTTEMVIMVALFLVLVLCSDFVTCKHFETFSNNLGHNLLMCLYFLHDKFGKGKKLGVENCGSHFQLFYSCHACRRISFLVTLETESRKSI